MLGKLVQQVGFIYKIKVHLPDEGADNLESCKLIYDVSLGRGHPDV